MGILKKMLYKLNSSYTIKRYGYPIYNLVHKKVEKDIEIEILTLYNQVIEKVEQGEYHRVIILLNEILLLNHKFILAYNCRAQVKIILGEYEEAIRDCNLSIKYNEINPLAYSNRGFANYSLGNRKLARADYNRALFLLEKIRGKESDEEIKKLREIILENIELLNNY